VFSDPLSTPLVATLAQHYDELVGYVRPRFGDRGFARDVVHDVCVQVLERPPAQTLRAPLAFLRRASLNQAIDRCRADDARNAVIETRPEPPEPLASDGHDGASALEFQRHLRSLVRIVEALPPRARQVFLLHCVHGMTHQEIAQTIGVTRSMVSHHFARAMRDIEAHWEPARALVG